MQRQFRELGAVSAILVGILSILYSFSFSILEHTLADNARIVTALCMLLANLLLLPLLITLYYRLYKISKEFALLGLVIGFCAALGAIMHAGYDLATAISVPYQAPAALANLPNQIDPRGLAAFGLMGLSIALWSWLLSKDKRTPRVLPIWGYITAFLLGLVYIMRLFIVYIDDPLLQFPLLITGFIATPVWYIWLGKWLWQTSR